MLLSKLFCKHRYVTVKIIEGKHYLGKTAKGTRNECPKCGKVKINIEFLD